MGSVKETLDQIRELGIVLVVRGKSADELMGGIQAVYEGGVRAIEITFSVADAVSLIAKLNERLGDKILLGAGTVMNPSDAVAAVNAGARYVVAPNTNIEVVGMAKRLGVPVMPGAYTPTEVVNAWNAGADVVKIFPASVGGPEYIRTLKGPLPDIPLMPTGGVDMDTAAAFLDAGAFALGTGTALFDKKLLAAKDYKGLTERAKAFVKIVKEARGKKK